ncbi:MAG: hypothetical protein ABR608_13715 [Pseudonocardiaceae bacterium]
MTQYSTTPQAQPAPAPHRFGALAWTAVILGIVGIVGSPIIFLNNLTAVVAAVGVVLGIIALFGTRKVLAGVGVALSVAGIAFTLVAQGAATEEFDREFDREFNSTQPLTYQAESSTGTVDVSYSSAGGSTSETGLPSPWTRDVQADNYGYFSVTLPYDADSSGEGTVTCRILSGGQVVAEQTATGEYASVSCSTPVTK